MVVVDMVVFPLELLQVRVVVTSDTRAIIAFEFPRVGIQRIVADHIAHGAATRCVGASRMLALIVIPFGGIATCPVRAVGVHVLSTDDIQFVSLEMIGRMYLHRRTINLSHIGL